MRIANDLTIAPSEPGSLFSPARRASSIGAVALCSMIAFEAIGVGAGMPAVAAALDGLSLYALAFAGTLASSIVAMVWSGQDCDRLGPMRSMVGGMMLFALGLLIAGLADSMTMLIAGRVVQGLGVGALCVSLYVAVARTVPEALHPRLFALFSTAWVIPAVVGPVISGWIVDYLGWRWLFLGIALLLLPTAALILPPLRGSGQRAVGMRSTGRALAWAVVAAVSCVALAISESAGASAGAIVGGLLAAIGLAASRLLPGGTLRLERGLPTVVALRALLSAAFFLCEAFIPLWLHQQRGWSITAAGLALTGGALSWSFGSQLQSRISGDACRERWLARGCFILLLGAIGCGVTVGFALPGPLMIASWSLAGLGIGLSLPMLGVLMLKLSPRNEQGTYSSALQLGAALGTSSSLAAGGLLFSMLLTGTPTAAYVSVFALASVCAATAWLTATRGVSPG